MFLFLNGNILKSEEVRISPFDRGFQFSDGVYEVIRYYPKKFFELESHLTRLKYSLSEMRIFIPDLSGIENSLLELIELNGIAGEESIAYIQITRGTQYPRKHSYADSTEPTFFMTVEKFPSKKNEMQNGIKAGLEEDIRWHRCDIKSTALIANVMSSRNAAEKGFTEIIYHRNGFITEGAHTNVCVITGDTVITPPLSNFILPGITRKLVLEICAESGITYFEKNISVDELKRSDEILILGTTTEITPVIEIDGEKIGNGKPGPLCKKLQQEYQKLFLSNNNR